MQRTKLEHSYEFYGPGDTGLREKNMNLFKKQNDFNFKINNVYPYKQVYEILTSHEGFIFKISHTIGEPDTCYIKYVRPGDLVGIRENQFGFDPILEGEFAYHEGYICDYKGISMFRYCTFRDTFSGGLEQIVEHFAKNPIYLKLNNIEPGPDCIEEIKPSPTSAKAWNKIKSWGGELWSKIVSKFNSR